MPQTENLRNVQNITPIQLNKVDGLTDTKLVTYAEFAAELLRSATEGEKSCNTAHATFTKTWERTRTPAQELYVVFNDINHRQACIGLAHDAIDAIQAEAKKRKNPDLIEQIDDRFYGVRHIIRQKKHPRTAKVLDWFSNRPK